MNLETELKRHFDYDSFRPLQKEIIESILVGNDTLAVLPTGAGKSICYQLPGMIKDGTCLVISPLISLMRDQVKQLNDNGICAVACCDGHILKPTGREKFIYISPEGLWSRVKILKTLKINLIAVDEVHCISQHGHEFRTAYRSLSRLKSVFGNALIIALTASATKETVRDIVEQLRIDAARIFRSSVYRPNLNIVVKYKDAELFEMVKIELLKNTLEICSCGLFKTLPAIVYCPTRKTAEYLNDRFKSIGVASHAYHAGMKSSERQSIEDDFMSAKVNLICATIAFGMGINKPDVRKVIHCSVPGSIEGYYQEIGRAGRDGKPSDCVLLYDPRDFALHDFFISRMKNKTARSIAIEKRNAMFDFVESDENHWSKLKQYFGEVLNED